jgi:hypothetical protein
MELGPVIIETGLTLIETWRERTRAASPIEIEQAV